MKKKIRKFSLKYKISITILIVALIPLVILGGSIIKMYDNAIKVRSYRHVYSNISNIASRVESVFANANLYSHYIELMLDEIEDESNREQIQNFLRRSVSFFEGIESVVYVTKEEQVYSSDVELAETKAEAILNSSYMKQLLDTDGEITLFDRTDDCMEVEDSVVTIGKKAIQSVAGEKTGYIFINISGGYLVDVADDGICDYLIFDNLGNSVVDYADIDLSVDYEVFKQAYEHPELYQYEYEDEEFLAVFGDIQEYGWKIIGLSSSEVFSVSQKEFNRIAVVVSSAVIALLLMVIYAASILITKPLLKLKAGAEEIANGNLDVNLDFRARDEIGELGAIFNEMTRKIKELLQRVDAEAKKKREYELALLQEQIKPHFLYNTLDIILVLIEMKREREAAHVVKKLAAYYRNSLSSSEDIIPIETEIQIIEDYLELQRVRYGEKFVYELYVDKEVKHECIPRLTLQPLVENAIYHGLKYKDNWGKILVEARAADQKVVIKVIDDGIGMNKEKLEEIVRFAEKAKKHFGLYSVNHRLKLYYGEHMTFKIDSEYGVGTCITIEIPRGDIHDKDYDRG